MLDAPAGGGKVFLQLAVCVAFRVQVGDPGVGVERGVDNRGPLGLGLAVS